MNAKIYASCSSFTYAQGYMLWPEAISNPPATMPALLFGGYHFDAKVSKQYGTKSYDEWKWNRVNGKPQCGSIKWAVQGLVSADPAGYAGGHAEWDNKCTGSSSSHSGMLTDADLIGDLDN